MMGFGSGFCPFHSGLGNWGGWGSLGAIGMIINALLFIGFVVLLVLGIRWIVRQFATRGSGAVAQTDALAIAQRRLAAGEINVAEFEEIRARIQR